MDHIDMRVVIQPEGRVGRLAEKTEWQDNFDSDRHRRRISEFSGYVLYYLILPDILENRGYIF